MIGEGKSWSRFLDPVPTRHRRHLTLRDSMSLSPPDDLLLAVVVSSLDALGHVSQGAEARLSGQSVSGERLQAPAGRLCLLQGGRASDVLPPDETQRVLQVALPQSRLGKQHQQQSIAV